MFWFPPFFSFTTFTYNLTMNSSDLFRLISIIKLQFRNFFHKFSRLCQKLLTKTKKTQLHNLELRFTI
ncbi:hypothetical protein X560_2048 [Listeria fleischmannii 1991]|uniref:Uncharacterized protein n=1 Tax=Listeria fleischmannii 1991 TaxID=1430899 RepID=A0A0J8J2W3_9LIST|nr:hypothetical protein X560_2048 [Listeria fleischmannii 1991]